MSDTRKYIVTLHRYEDLDDFYEDMETVGGNLHIPNRRVECCNRREISRNTHYLISDEEAQLVRNDPRVLAVELDPQELGIRVVPMGFTQSSSNWNKSFSLSNDMLNWGILRCWEGEQRTNWGSDGTTNQTGTVTVNASGKNVDVVIVDGHFDPDHPDYGGRVIQRNWFESSSGTYLYPPYVDEGNATRTDNNNHGAHVAGTVVGETLGWAREANIYNINPYGSNINGSISSTLFDLIREFHNNKPINEQTGRRNPTIANNSWGQIVRFDTSDVSSINWRGNNISGPFTDSTLKDTYGLDASNGEVDVPFRSSALDADVQDAINDGVIMVGAAGNNGMLIDVEGGIDYNNTVTGIPQGNVGTFTIPYHRGSSPASASNGICVGAIGTTVDESKATFSNTGPRLDVYAPGSAIISTVNSGGVSDSRDSSYFLNKISGTSMASPQVCGILTLAMETYPDLTQSQAIDFVSFISKDNQITDNSGDPTVFSVSNSGASAYLIDGDSNPTLNLQRGKTYTFNVNASGHPFWIKTAQTTGTGDAYNDGVTNNGEQSGTISFVVPQNAPSTLFYICQFHGSMTGTLSITDSSDYDNPIALQGGPNKYIAFRQERPIDGAVFPKNNFFLRESGQVYPRTRIRK